MKTWIGKTEEADRKWWIVDATDKTLGRLASEVAKVIRGKNKPEFTPHADMGDFVVVLNSDKVKMTGNKLDQKKYYSHSGYFGSLKEITARKLMEKDSRMVIEHAVKGMLPKNRLGSKLIGKLKVYKGAEHPHAAQKPQAMNVQ